MHCWQSFREVGLCAPGPFQAAPGKITSLTKQSKIVHLPAIEYKRLKVKKKNIKYYQNQHLPRASRSASPAIVVHMALSQTDIFHLLVRHCLRQE